MAGAEDLNRILDGMDEEMLGAYNDYELACVEPWVSFKGNAGQDIIVVKYIIPAASQHAQRARPDWPETDNPDGYVDALYSCYDSDVIYSAFSDTIDNIYADLTEYWEFASQVQYEHAALLSGGENAGPHSTHDVWRGGPVGPTQ